MAAALDDVRPAGQMCAFKSAFVPFPLASRSRNAAPAPPGSDGPPCNTPGNMFRTAACRPEIFPYLRPAAADRGHGTYGSLAYGNADGTFPRRHVPVSDGNDLAAFAAAAIGQPETWAEPCWGPEHFPRNLAAVRGVVKRLSCKITAKPGPQFALRWGGGGNACKPVSSGPTRRCRVSGHPSR